MLAGKVIDGIAQELERIPQGSKERTYQTAFIKLLGEMGLQAGPHRTDSGGVADIFVRDSEPPLLIEIKQSGDWRCVAEAAAQLWTYSVGLPPSTQKVAVFGGHLMHEALKSMLDRLEVRYVIRVG